MFLTWNESKHKLEARPHAINQQCTYLRVDWSISNQLHFLDILITNYHYDGTLRTEVVHDLGIQPYSLPYLFGHTRNNYRTSLRNAFYVLFGVISMHLTLLMNSKAFICPFKTITSKNEFIS